MPVALLLALAQLLGQLLAQLHAPLVKAVDAPNRPGAEHAVLIQSDQGPDRGRIELLQQ